MPPGHPTKKKINFTGLRNQGPCVIDPLKSAAVGVNGDGVEHGLSKNRNSTANCCKGQ